VEGSAIEPAMETLMLTTDCPWCDGPMAVDATSSEVVCDACDVRAVIAPDVPATLADAA
jgi:uncharacterized protein YbaR (Trm112 family)